MSEMDVVVLEVKAVEELALKSAGETATGYVNAPLALPLPSTVAGALAAAGWAVKPGCSSGRDRVGRFKSCLAALGAEVYALRGPFFRAGDDVYTWVWPGELLRLDVGLLREWYEAQSRGCSPGKRAVQALCGGDEECAERYRGALRRISYAQRTSARLVRGLKVVDEGAGALFKVPHVSYGEGRILVEVFGKGFPERLAARLGGEGRVALFAASRGGVYSMLKNLWGSNRGGDALLLLATPLLIEYPVEDYLGRIAKVLKENGRVKDVKGRVYSAHPKVKPLLQPFQPGFDEVRGVKEPYVAALTPGAVLHAEVSDWEKVYMEGAGLYRELGYGTLVPIPLG